MMIDIERTLEGLFRRQGKCSLEARKGRRGISLVRKDRGMSTIERRDGEKKRRIGEGEGLKNGRGKEGR